MKKKLYIGSNLIMYKNVDSTLKYLTELETLTVVDLINYQNTDLLACL